MFKLRLTCYEKGSGIEVSSEFSEPFSSTSTVARRLKYTNDEGIDGFCVVVSRTWNNIIGRYFQTEIDLNKYDYYLDCITERYW